MLEFNWFQGVELALKEAKSRKADKKLIQQLESVHKNKIPQDKVDQSMRDTIRRMYFRSFESKD